jgi:diguanylate cyclase (GGDEF)-like protein
MARTSATTSLSKRTVIMFGDSMRWNPLRIYSAVIADLESCIPEQHRTAIGTEQLAVYYGNLRAGSVANVLNAMVVAVAFWGSIATWVLVGWIGLITVTVAGRLAQRTRGLKLGARMDAQREMQRSISGGLMIGLVWGASFLIFGIMANPMQMMIVGICAAGMISGGLLSLGSVPRVAMPFVLAVSINLIGLFTYYAIAIETRYGVVMTALCLSYIGLSLYGYRSNFSAFVAQILGRIDAHSHGETVRLLLNDYEEQGAAWLWDVDANGVLGVAGHNFAVAAERPPELLTGTHLAALFTESPEREMLEGFIADIQPFRDITLPLLIGGEERWWSLSARPRVINGATVGLHGVGTDVTTARMAEAKVAYMAHYDSLTDLPNRFLFNETFARALKRKGIRARQTAVLCLDLDQFKNVNDTLGHPVGDKLLKEIARRLEANISGRDMVARLGGDEFAILHQGNTTRAELSEMADKLIAAVSAPIIIDGNAILPATSVGIAVSPDDGTSVADLLKNADLALYSSKDGGRNRYSFFEPAMDEAARARREMEMDIRAALSRHELSLSYQPLIDIETGHPVGYEALMRWNHPERGAISPTEFIPIAEETGLIVQLGEWVIREAIAEAASWPEHLSVSINLSPAQMRSPGLISCIVNTLAQTGVAANRVELEITEGVLMQDSETNIAILHKLNDLGLSISLDDFGTGYSSLNYLRAFPFKKIKIDRCFVDGIDSRDDCRAIIQSVVQLAKSLGMTTTAEGVERSSQLSQLNLEGCTQAQGFLFSKAVPASELTDLRSPAEHFPRNNYVSLLPPADIVMPQNMRPAKRIGRARG